MKMTIEIIRDFQGFERLRGEWNDLVSQCRFNVFYLTFEWLFSWWKNFGAGNELFLILVRDDERLIAGAPLMIKKTRLGKIILDRKLQFIASNVSDYMDFVVIEKAEECFSLIFDKIKSHYWLWDWAEFVNISEDSKNISFWLNYYDSNCIVLKEIRDLSVFIDLGRYSSWEEYSKNLSKRIKCDLARQENNLEKYGEMSFYALTNYDKNKSVFDKFFELHKRRWAAKGLRSHFYDDRMKDWYLTLAKDLSDSGKIELSYLTLNESIIALSLGFIYENSYYYYSPVFDLEFKKFSPGKLLLSNLIKESFKKGFKRFDLLLGGENYKFSWSGNKINLYSIILFKKTLASRIKYIYKRQRPKLARIPFLRQIKRRFIKCVV